MRISIVSALLAIGCAAAPTPSGCPPFRVDVRVPGNRALDRAALAPIVGRLEEVRPGPLAYYDLFEAEGGLDDAVGRLRTAYFDRGYVQVSVAEPAVELADDRATLRITIPVSEGPRYRIGTAQVVEVDEGGEPYGTELPFGVEPPPLPPPETPRGLPGVRDGSFYSRSVVDEAIEQVRALYGEHGYALVDLEPFARVDVERARIDLTLHVRRGTSYVIDAVEVLDERDGPRAEDTGIRVGERYVRSRVDAAQRALERRYPDREIRARVEPIDDAPGRALLRFVLLER